MHILKEGASESRGEGKDSVAALYIYIYIVVRGRLEGKDGVIALYTCIYVGTGRGGAGWRGKTENFSHFYCRLYIHMNDVYGVVH